MRTDASSTNLLDAQAWGASGWTFLHACVFSYPERDPTAAMRQSAFWLLRSLDHMLPCEKCAEHYRYATRHVTSPQHNVFNTRSALSRFYVDLHNDVNERLSKPIVSYDKVERAYANNTKCPPDGSSDHRFARVLLSATLLVGVFASLIVSASIFRVGAFGVARTRGVRSRRV